MGNVSYLYRHQQCFGHHQQCFGQGLRSNSFKDVEGWGRGIWSVEQLGKQVFREQLYLGVSTNSRSGFPKSMSLMQSNFPRDVWKSCFVAKEARIPNWLVAQHHNARFWPNIPFGVLERLQTCLFRILSNFIILGLYFKIF